MNVMLSLGALALGEFLASGCPQFADAWPVMALAAAFVTLFGFGWAWRGWPLVTLFLLGFSLYLLASQAEERRLRDSPWLRGREYQTSGSVGVLRDLRRSLRERAAIGLQHDAELRALNRSILIGDRLSSSSREVFSRSGTVHVFAISGLHVMAVAKVIVILVSLLMVPRRFAGVVALPIVWTYVGVIGFSPSAVRAAIMASFQSVAPLFYRRTDGLRSWQLTFLIVHLVDPLMIDHVGNALSFVVMLAIVLAGRLPFGSSVIFVTTMAWAAGVPICAHVFGTVSFGGLLANVFVLALAAGTVSLGMLGIAASTFSITLASHLNNLSALTTHTMVIIARTLANIRFLHFSIPNWTYLQCLEWYALVLLILFLITYHRKNRVF